MKSLDLPALRCVSQISHNEVNHGQPVLVLPGLRCVGQVTNPDVNHGQPVPLYEPFAPEGRPNINTLEGWNAAAEKANNRAFCQTFGREPVCSDELKAWEKSDFSSEFVWIGNPHDRKDFTE